MCDNTLELVKGKRGFYFRCESYPDCNVTRKTYHDEMESSYRDLTWEKFCTMNPKHIDIMIKKHQKWAE